MEGLQTSFGRYPSAATACSMLNYGNHQQLANSLTALLLHKRKLCPTDALSGVPAAASRSGSPYMAGQDANNATGVLLEASAMHLPAAAKPLQTTTIPLSAAHVSLPTYLQPCAAGNQCCRVDSQCSHSSAHTEDAVATPPHAVSLSKAAPKPASPVALGQQTTAQSVAEATAAVTTASRHTPASDAAATAVTPLPKPHVPAATAGSAKSWLYQLVTCPYLFKPCPQCAPTHSGREVLITYFDPDDPSVGYCTYCPQRASKPRLLQIRRSTYHEVVKAADISRLADVSGIQHYVINGAKVLFLRPRPQPRPPKGVVAPARCTVDGRQLMDAHSNYCSLRCKLEVEDKVFAENYPSAAEEMEAAAAGDGTDAATMGLAGTYHRQGGHEGRRVVVPNSKRPAAATPGADHPEEGSSEEGEGGDHRGPRAKRQRNLPSKFANTVLGGSANYQSAGTAGHCSRSHQPQHSHQQRVQQGSKATMHSKHDDAVGDQLVGALVARFAGYPAGESDVIHGGKVQDEQVHSPCASEDSARSSTCNQRWHHKRKVLQPCRAPLQ